MSHEIGPLVLKNAYLPANYKLSLDIVPSKPNFQGDLQVDLIANAQYSTPPGDEDSALELQFHSSNIVVTSAMLIDPVSDVKHAAQVSYDRAAELVSFKVPSEGPDFRGLSGIKLHLKYVGKISNIKTYQDTTAGVFKTNYLNGLTGKADNHIIATHCQPKFARLILPCIDELASKPTFELSIKTDIKYTCVSNAIAAGTDIVDDVKKVVRFEKTPPMTPSIFGFVVGDLEYVEQTVKLQDDTSLPLRVYTPIGELENASYPLNIAALSLPELEKLMHHRFPLQKLDFVALPFLNDSAMENWGLIAIQQSFLLIEPEAITKDEYADQLKSLREVIVHELVHQWMGNMVTFDDWSHLWLNEAFATFAAYAALVKLNLSAGDKSIWLNKCLTDFQRVLEQNSLPTANPIFVKHAVQVKSTADALSQDSYFKGIPLLRSLANLFNSNNDDDFETFFKIVGDFLQAWRYRTFKPTDLWNFMTKSELNERKVDVSTLLHSWTRLAGYPLLKVDVTETGKVSIVQHRYLHGVKIEDDSNFEDVPYHIPVTCRLKDGSIVRSMLTDRSKTFDIDPETLLTVNANYSNVVRVQYNSKLYSNIAAGIHANELSNLDLLAIATDLGNILGSIYQEEDDLIGFSGILEAYTSSTTVLHFASLDVLLTIAQNLSTAIELVNNESNLKLVKTFHKWLASVIVSLKDKVAWDVKEFNYSKASNEELRARNSILIIGTQLAPQEFAPIVKKLYKNLQHGPKRTIPQELLNSILAGVLKTSNQQKEYKEVLALAKAPTLTTNNIIKRGQPESAIRGVLQTSAVLSLGYVSAPDLVLKTLNFVMTNIDSKLIELALIGLQLQPALKQQLWDWYVLHFNTWCLKSYREGSQYAKQMKATLRNISKIIFVMMLNNTKNLKKLNAFVNEKMSSSLYNKFNTQEILDEVKMENEERVIMNAHNPSLSIWINSH